MRAPDLTAPRRIHLIGVGGAGMSAIAGVLLGMGHTVTGTDSAEGPALSRLRDAGADARSGHHPDMAVGADVVARSTAVPDDDPEVAAVTATGRQVFARADLLSAICATRRTVAISGTHGKTTTSSMVAVTMSALGWHPSMIVGGEIAGIGAGWRFDPAGEWLVVEADESDGTFLRLGAEAVVVTSVEADHLEHYGSMSALRGAFEQFVSASPGPVVVCADDRGAAALAACRPREAPAVTYGTSPAADVVIEAVKLDRFSAEFTVSGRLPAHPVAVRIAVPGVHNVRNATASMTVAAALGSSWEDAAAAVGTYRGVGRRFERKAEWGGVTFVDGYDHLPGEVAAAIATARAGGWKRVVVAFQPHRYSRTQALWQDFADAFVGADELLLTGIYAAGEPEREGVTGHLIEKAVREAHPEAGLRYAETLDEAAAALAAILRPGDVCLTLGAGDVTTLSGKVLDLMGAG